MSKIDEIVKSYVDTYSENADFVRCTNCGELQLIQIGGTACGKCESENLQWYQSKDGKEIQEASAFELSDMGFVID